MHLFYYYAKAKQNRKEKKGEGKEGKGRFVVAVGASSIFKRFYMCISIYIDWSPILISIPVFLYPSIPLFLYPSIPLSIYIDSGLLP